MPANAHLLNQPVVWRWRGNKPGVIAEVLDGCNPLFRVAFDDRDPALLPKQDLAHPDGRRLDETA
jgi:hypothetical protein